uniref:Uncharacterized protein n=1 Tax=Daphnia magna TaxID=35525 RepID=A0A0P6G638_9CRUS
MLYHLLRIQHLCPHWSPTVLLERKRIIMARCYLLAILLCSQLVVSTLGLPVAPGEPLDETNDGQLILPIADGESDNSQNIASLPVNPISEDSNEDKDAEYAVDGTAYQAELMAIEQDPLTQSLPDETKSYRTKRGLSKKGKKIVKKAVQVGRIAISYAVGKIPPLF